MNKLIKVAISLSVVFAALSAPKTLAAVSCSGTIDSVYKWDYFDTLSIRIKLANGEFTPWVSMPTQSDESIAMVGFATQKNMNMHLTNPAYTACTGEGAWPNNARLVGYLMLKNEN